MKFRKDFVTNSSSSSFVCEICGRSEEGMDISMSDCEMVQCVNGHTICEDETLEADKNILIKVIMENEYNEATENELNDMVIEDLYSSCDGEMRYSIPEDFCPICQFIEYSQNDLSKYLLIKYGVSRDLVFEEVKKLNKRRKKLYENEYITHVCKEFNLNPSEIVAGWKKEFGTYNAFRAYITH